MTLLRSLRLPLFAMLLVGLPACSKKSEESSQVLTGPTVVDSELAKKIPGSSVGFVIWDGSSDAYKRYKTSPWGQGGSSNFIKAIEQADPTGQSAPLKPFLDVLQKTGLLTSQPGQPEVLKAAVAFVDLGPAGALNPAVGIYANANPGQNLKNKLAEIETVFKNEGYPIAKRTTAPDGFTIDIKGEVPDAPKVATVIFAANESSLAVATQEPLIARLFDANSDNGMTTIIANPEYQKTLGTLSSPNQISLGYLDVKSALTKLGSFFPADAPQNANEILNAVPIESVGGSTQMGQGLATTLLAHIVPRDDEQKSWLALLSGATSHATLDHLPLDTVFALSIDGSTLMKIRDKAATQMDPAAAAEMKKQLASLDAFNNVTIAVRGGNEMSPFPEVFLVASGADASVVQSALRTTVNEMLKSFGLALGDWQTKDVEGTKLEFLMTPLGVGAFQAAVGNSVVLATSEMAATDAIKTAKDASKSLKSAAPASMRELLTKGSLLFIYSNFERMTALVKSVQGNMAMFTGGQPAVTDEAIEHLARIGVFSASVALNGDMLRIDSRYDAPAAK